MFLESGEQHDVKEALEVILTRTRLGNDLFNIGAQCHRRPDLVQLPGFTDDGWWYKNFTGDQQVVRMQKLIRDCFKHLEEKLLLALPLLAIVIPPLAHDESDNIFWFNGTNRERRLRSDWDNCNIALGDHVAGHSVSDEHAMYTLAGYVAYEGDEDVKPSHTIIKGHFATYFREGDAWYKADDSTVTPTGTGGAPPTDFPYICIFKRAYLGISLSWTFTSFITDETE